jgi:hypothetical protein
MGNRQKYRITVRFGKSKVFYQFFSIRAQHNVIDALMTGAGNALRDGP